jgi:hypothetical protein
MPSTEHAAYQTTSPRNVRKMQRDASQLFKRWAALFKL